MPAAQGRPWPRRRALACALGVMLCAAPVARTAFAEQTPPLRDGVRKNAHGDPFFALSAAAGAACPMPLGPRLTPEEAADNARHRAARGTKSDSYKYDADIATAVREQLRDARLLAGTSLWITVQRRFVYVDGCVPGDFDRLPLQRQLASIPEVDRVFVRVTSDPRAMLPYPTPAAPH